MAATRKRCFLPNGNGLELVVGGFRIDGANSPNANWDGGANHILSVVRNSAGLFTVTLNKPYPRDLVSGEAHLHRASNVTTDIRAILVNDSYSASAGTFQIFTLVNDGTPAIGEPDDNSTITFEIYFQSIDAHVESHGS
jgi:hypothetical protein